MLEIFQIMESESTEETAGGESLTSENCAAANEPDKGSVSDSSSCAGEGNTTERRNSNVPQQSGADSKSTSAAKDLKSTVHVKWNLTD